MILNPNQTRTFRYKFNKNPNSAEPPFAQNSKGEPYKPKSFSPIPNLNPSVWTQSKYWKWKQTSDKLCVGSQYYCHLYNCKNVINWISKQKRQQLLQNFCTPPTKSTINKSISNSEQLQPTAAKHCQNLSAVHTVDELSLPLQYILWPTS
jgi:hypothetical protein